MPPTDTQKLAADRIAAEMLLHIGRGMMAAQLGKDQLFRDALANSASVDVMPDAFAMPFDGFSGATANSLSIGKLAETDWPGLRRKILGLCVRMGYDAELAASTAPTPRKVSAADLDKAMKAIQKTDCPGGTPGHGAGDLCP